MLPEDTPPRVDRIFAAQQNPIELFRFDERVATVFPDMIARSVPGYAQVLDGLTALAQRVVRPNTQVYDLGCSLGAATLSVLRGVDQAGVRVLAVDNSPAMIDRARERLAGFKHRAEVQVILSDILEIDIEHASLVLLNYTLQFIPIAQRQHLCARIYRGLAPGGVLVLSEKIAAAEPAANAWLIELHEDFKRSQGYSELEIAQKRTALEGVLIPESLTQHVERLHDVGFRVITTWFQHYNFASLLAVKCD